MQHPDTFWTIAIILAAIVSLFTVRWAYFKILKIAKDKNVVDNPDARKLQKTPVPVMGGIAVFIGVVAGLLLGAALCSAFELESVVRLLPIVLAMVVMLYTGSMDDILGLTPMSRIIIESSTLVGLIVASGCCVDSFHGLWDVEEVALWFAISISVVSGVGIINAVNMIDGVNGLSSGLCISCCILYGFVFYFSGDMANALLAFSMAAALLPFFFHNVFGMRSRMFIGDAGTMVMGILLTWFTFSVLCKDADVAAKLHIPNANLIAMALAILSVPVFDTLRVMVMRLAKRQSPFHPDKTHLHHVFVNVGISHSIITFVEISINLLVVSIWVLSVAFGASMDWQLYIVIIASLILVCGTYFFLRNQADRHTGFMHWLAHFSLSTHLGDKNWWLKLQMLLDKGEMVDNQKPENKPNNGYHIVFDSNPNNYKERDRKKMLEFMKGKAEVLVDDIKQQSGAETFRVDAMLSEGEVEGYIKVVSRTFNGSPIIVTLADNVTF